MLGVSAIFRIDKIIFMAHSYKLIAIR